MKILYLQDTRFISRNNETGDGSYTIEHNNYQASISSSVAVEAIMNACKGYSVEMSFIIGKNPIEKNSNDLMNNLNNYVHKKGDENQEFMLYILEQ